MPMAVVHDGTMDHSLEPDHLTEAGQRLTRTVDGFSGDDWDAASVLPGWTRAHVIAHLALNGEALGGVLRGVEADEPVPMYCSQDARDADIKELAAADHAELRERLLLVSLTTFQDAVVAMPDESWSGRFDRTGGGWRHVAPRRRTPHAGARDRDPPRRPRRGLHR